MYNCCEEVIIINIISLNAFEYLFIYIYNEFKYINIINIPQNINNINEMSNIFKNNNRFAGLVDKSDYDKSSTSVKLMKKMGWKEGNGLGKNEDGIKTPLAVEKRESNSGLGFNVEEKRVNTFKDNSFRENNFRERRQNRYIGENERQRIMEQYQFEEKARKEFEKQDDDRKTQESLKMDNFPELVINKIENDIQLDESYIDKLKKVEVKIERNIDCDLENLKPGWTLIKKDNLTGKIILKSNVQINNIPFATEDKLPLNLLDTLVELHQRRTEEYIELNGYDNWEKMFKFPNWKECEDEIQDNSDEEYENISTDEDD